MTEKPFTFHISEYDEVVITKENDGREFFIGNEEDINMDYIIGLVDLLNEQHETIQDLYESDKSLRKMCSNVTHNWTGICVKRKLFEETLKTLKELGCEDLADDLSKTSIVTGVNGC